MSKNPELKKTNNDEIDLLDLFGRMGKTLSKWFRATGKGLLVCIIFLIRNFATLLVSLVMGVFVSYIFKWSTKPEYLSEITFRSNTVPNAEMISFINKLKLLLQEKNYNAIATSLSVSVEKAERINDIEAFWVIDMTYDSIVRYFHVQGIDKVFAGNDKEMMGRHRRNILDDHHKIVLENLSGRNLSPDYLTENAIIHPITLANSIDFMPSPSLFQPKSWVARLFQHIGGACAETFSRQMRNSRLPFGPRIGDSVTPRTSSFKLSARACTPSTTSRCFAGSRTTPPFPTSPRPTSNCGLIKATMMPVSLIRPMVAGSTL